MASGDWYNSLPQIIGTVVGVAAKEYMSDKRPTNAGAYVPRNRGNGHQNFNKDRKQFRPHSDFNSKKVTQTLEKLVDAKEEALSQEKIRRRKAELEVMDLQQQLKKVQVGNSGGKQIYSTVKKDPNSGKSTHHYTPDGTRGGGRGGYTNSGRGGYKNKTSSGERGQLGPSKLNNGININSEHTGYKKVYNKQPFFDCSAPNFLGQQSDVNRDGGHSNHRRTQKQQNSGPKNAHRGK